MRALWTILETARQTLLLLVRSRMLWLLALPLVGMPILLGVLAATGHLPRRATADTLFVATGAVLQLYVLMPWATMYFAVQAVHGDIEDRTFQFLFLRPVPRSALLLGKWLAAWLLSFALIAAGLAGLLWALLLGGAPWQDDVAPWSRWLGFAVATGFATMAYAAVGAFFAARFRRPLIWSAFYIVGLEYFVASLPPEAGIRSAAIIDAMRRMLLSDFDRPPGRIRNVLWPPDGRWMADYAGHPDRALLWVTGICLLIAILVYARSEYDSRPRE